MIDSKRPVRLQLPCPPPSEKGAWGDFYFGQSLATALERQGHPVYLSFQRRGDSLMERWAHFRQVRSESFPDDCIDLILRGKRYAPPKSDRPALLWLISQSDTFGEREAKQYAHIFVASEKFLPLVRSMNSAAELLLQCTDPAHFHPAGEPSEPSVVFVGNRKKTEPRPVVEASVGAGFDVKVWGQNWDKVAGVTYMGRHVPNSELGSVYGSARVVLNDHRAGMREHHFASNRVFDVLATGRPVVTERMDGIPDELHGGIYMYDGQNDVGRAVKEALDADEGELQRISQIVRERYSFDDRARIISDVITKI